MLSLLAGLLMPLGYPPWNLYLLSLFSLVPLLCALCLCERYRDAFLVGLCCGLVAFGIQHSWLLGYRRWGGNWAFPLFLFPLFYQSFVIALFALLFHAAKKRWDVLYVLLGAPFVWTLLEYIGLFGVFGFPELVGHTQLFNPVLREGAPLLGVNYLSFLVVSLDSFLILFWLERKRNRLRAVAPLVVLGLMVTANHFLYGHQRERIARKTEAPVPLAVILTGRSPSVLNQVQNSPETYSMYLTETQRFLARAKPALIVWPEMVFPYITNWGGESLNRLFGILKDFSGEILLGGAELQEKKIYYNSAYLFSQGRFRSLYRKEKLFPFGEYTPMRRFFGFIKNFVPLKLKPSEFSPGRGTGPIRSKIGDLGLSICFETSYSDLTRRQVQRGADLLINLTNDAWFSDSRAPELHFFLGGMRAFENGRYYVQAANYGISGVIDPEGRTIQRTGPQSTDSFEGTVARISEKTLYTRLGLWRFVVFFGISALYVVMEKALTAFYAAERTRTSTGLLPHDPESCVSANSTTAATV